MRFVSHMHSIPGWLSTAALVAAFCASCSQHTPTAGADAEPPKASATASTLAAPTAPAAASSLPSPSPAPAALPFKQFAGFSADGSRFVQIDAFDAYGEEPFTVVRTKIGDASGTKEGEPLEKKQLPAIVAKLKKEGFSSERRPAPADLTLEAKLGATPPTLALLRGGARNGAKLAGRGPFSASAVAEIWGVSADGKTAAIHVSSRPAGYEKATDALHSIWLVPVP